MANLSTGGSGGGAAYTYVQDAEPSGAEEGESWYDTGANAAYVYDGAAWIEQTVAAHGDLSGVGASDHHAKPTGTGDVNSFRTELTTPPDGSTYDWWDGDSTTYKAVDPNGQTVTFTFSGGPILSDGVDVQVGFEGFTNGAPVEGRAIMSANDGQTSPRGAVFYSGGGLTSDGTYSHPKGYVIGYEFDMGDYQNDGSDDIYFEELHPMKVPPNNHQHPV